jgi:hypothetical protein
VGWGARLAGRIGWKKVDECKHLWVLKNSLFVPNRQNLGDRKYLPNPRRSIVGLPNEILFLLISREGVFQQPHLLTAVMIALEAMGKFPFWGQALLRHYIRQTGPFAMQR